MEDGTGSKRMGGSERELGDSVEVKSMRAQLMLE